MARDFKPVIRLHIDVWDADIEVTRSEYADINVSAVRGKVGADQEVTLLFDTSESEAAFFDAIAAVRPAEKPSEQVA